MTKGIENYKEYIIKEYFQGKTAIDIAKEINFHNSTISRALHKWGISRGYLSKRVIDIQEKVIKSYTKDNMYCEDIAKKFKVDVHTIYRILDRANIKRQTGYHSQCVLNYFDKIDTPNKAYILGFITADGSVVNNVLSIEVHEKDSSVLEFIKNEINPNATIFNPVVHEIVKNEKRVSFCAKQLGLDLSKYNVIQNKSKTIQDIPDEKLLPKELRKYYFRGLIDGDGCVHKNGGLSIYSGSKDFIKNIQSTLCKDAGVSQLGIYHGTAYFITWSSKQDKQLLYNYLYKDCLEDTFYYKRKYQRLYNSLYDNTEVSN